MDAAFGKNAWEYIYTEKFGGSKIFVRSSPKWLTFEEGVVTYWRLEDYLTPQYQYVLKGHHDDYDFTFMSEIGFYQYCYKTTVLTCLKQETFAESMGQGKKQSETTEAYILSSVVMTENKQVIEYLTRKFF